MKIRTKKRQVYDRIIALMFVAVLAFSSISWVESKAEDNTPTKYEVSDYQGETSYPTQEGKVFAGWYQDAAYTKAYTEDTGEAYAKFVDEKVLTVKKQMKVKDDNTDQTNGIRFLTAIDTLRFSKVVFHVEVPEQGKTYDMEETVAYSSIMVEGVEEPQLASKVFGTDEAQYFVAHSLTGIPLGASGSMFRITPYWYTLDGKKVAGTPAAFTVDEATVADSLFTDSVIVNGKQVDSAVQKWNLSNASNGILEGSYSMGSSLQPMYFAQTGQEMLLQTTMAYSTVFEDGVSYQGDLMGGIFVSDGTNTSYFGVRQHGVVYGSSLDWIEKTWPYDVMSTWNKEHLTAEVNIALQDGVFHIYVDGIYNATLNLSTIMPNTPLDAELAFGLTMHADKASDIQFSDIQFTTDAEQVEQFFSTDALFANQVTVNGTTVKSGTSYWDISGIKERTIRATLDAECINQPMYFAQTGKTMLMQSTVTVTKDTTSNPVAGVYVTDGTKSGYIGVRGDGIVYRWDSDGKNDWYRDSNNSAVMWSSQMFAPTWGGPATAEVSVAYKEGYFHFFVDGVYGAKVPIALTMTQPASDADLAFGLVSYTEASKMDMTFSDVQFTTDSQKVATFLNSDEIYIDYGTGLGDDLQYNSELYGMNQSNDVEGADPGAFYVSPEEDETWGGYYYMYQTGSTRDDGVEVGSVNAYAFRCYRSKDLYQWELCGTLDQGYSLVVDWGDWSMDAFWAPEVIRNPQDGKYYMYFSAASRPEWGATVEGLSSSTTWSDRLYLGVAVADTPVGPFDMLYDTDATTGKRIPTINFHTGCNTTYDWAAIDASPFFDDDGTFYLYFNKHTDSNYQNLKGVWGMKMKSMTEPDYSTVSYLAKPYKYTVANTPGKIEATTSVGSAYEWYEGDINEAPFMVKHNGKYYLTYASNGYQAVDYSVHQAISDKPLSGFVKLSSAQGNPVLDGSVHGGSTYNYMNGTAHHSIVQNGDEMWIVYHRHNSTEGVDAGMDRSICADRVQFVTNSQGTEVLTANGPSMSLQWLPESISGYKNLAQSATVTISTGSGKEYLTDELLPFYEVVENRVMTATSDVTVTMKWDEAISVSSVMIYNAYNKGNAFSKVSDLRFTLAGEQAGKYAVIPELEFPTRYMSNSVGAFVPCAPAVAEFDTLKITELQFTIPASSTVNITEVVVLGSEEKSLTNISNYESFSTVTNDSDVKIDGTLDETVWGDKRWFSNTYLSNTDGTLPVLKTTGFTTSKGIYIASVVKDSNIVNDGQHTMLTNSVFDFRIAANNVGDTATKKAWQTHHIMIDMRGDVHCDGASNFKRVVTVEGTSATVEIFIPWEYLGVDTTKGIPSEFAMFPGYRAMLPGTTEIANMGCALGVTAEDVDKYWKFDATGYQSGDWKGALVGDSATGLTKVGVWDVSREHENTVESCAGTTEHTIFFRYMYGSDFIAEATLLPKGTLGSGTPQGGFYFLDAAGNTHSMLLDMTKYPNGVTLTVVKSGNTYRHYTDGKLLKTETVDTLNATVFPALHAQDADIVFKDYSCKKISEQELKNYLSKHLFVEQVVVNGNTVRSASDLWVQTTNENGAVLTGCQNQVADKPMYFAETLTATGTTALVQTTAANISTSGSGAMMAKIIVSDGVNSGWIGVRETSIVYEKNGTWIWKQAQNLTDNVLASWGGASSVKYELVLQGEYVYVYLNGLFAHSFNVTEEIPNVQWDKELAFGLSMSSTYANGLSEIQFSNIEFTTDATKVDAFLAEKVSTE